MQQVEPYKLTTLPQILLELQDELQNPARSYSSVSNIIRKDAALLVRVIIVASNEQPDQSERSGTLSELCAMIGYDALQAIAFSSSAYQAFRSYQNDQIAYLEYHWCRAFMGAQIALSLSKITSYREPEEAYLCALVRGIGQLVMEIQSNGLISKKMSTDGSASNCLIYEVEQFGINHNLLSAHLIDQWGVDPCISDAVKYQAKPVEAILDAHHLVKIVNLASHAVDDQSGNAQQFIQNANILFAIDTSTARALLGKSRDDAIDAANSYGIDWRDSVPIEDDSSSSNAAARPIKPDLENSHRFREKHQQLRAQVKDISLVSSICHTADSGHSESELLSLVRSALRSLLNAGSSLFFLYGKHTDTIKIAGHENVPAFLKEISIPVERDRSVLSNSLLDNKPVRFFSEGMSELESLVVVDRQFLNYLGTTGFYCHPFYFDGRPLGVLLVGIDQGHIDSIPENTQLLKMLMFRLGNLLKDFYWLQEQHKDIVENQTKTYEISVKKAIHEANNPLSVVQNYLEIMGRKLDDNSSAKENLLIVKSEITRVCDILERLGRQRADDDPEFALFDINQLVADQVEIFSTSNTYPNQIETKLELDNDIPSIWGSENALKQILTNLILNSIEAMPTGGVISISTADQFYLNEDWYVEISIQDTGTGIDASVMPRLFEVKRSLKGKKHSGIGLNIVHSLVSKMGGLITCRNSRHGVTWQILLPRKLEH
ncbi:MAG: HDOD domain-containing protein [Pseudomonadales bacterium]|jgi:signal transduction histidine kinase/HD-like signal output (HDOD) protein|nr:HDOD domain-containing protein [Pseudomonadales bacterium]